MKWGENSLDVYKTNSELHRKSHYSVFYGRIWYLCGKFVEIVHTRGM